jgi:hypothetical protein
VREVVEPDRTWEQGYADGYESFRELYPALKAHFARQRNSAQL